MDVTPGLGGEAPGKVFPVAAVLPHSDEMMNQASAGIFYLRYPDHPMASLYEQIADQVA